MSTTEHTSENVPAGARPVRLARPALLLGLIFGCAILSILGAAGYVGYQAGLDQRDAQFQATQAVELKTQYDLGVGDLAAGRYVVAAERFAYILEIDPGYPGAADKLAEARRALNVTVTPTPAATRTPPPVSQDPAEIFALAQAYFEAGDWDAAIAQIALLRTIDPNYQAFEADSLLAGALRHRGVARIQGDAMEAGISDLNHAEAFAPLDEEAANYRRWATFYLDARSYWGVNWEQAVSILQVLHLIAPNFKDTTALLYQATLSYAAQLDAAGDACGAAAQYSAALALQVDPAIVDAQATADANCLLTPTGDGSEPGGTETTPEPPADGTPSP